MVFSGQTLSVESAADLLAEHEVVEQVGAEGLRGTILAGLEGPILLIQGLGSQLLRFDILPATLVPAV